MEEAEMVYTEYMVECVMDVIFAERPDLEEYWHEELAEGEPSDVAE